MFLFLRLGVRSDAAGPQQASRSCRISLCHFFFFYIRSSFFVVITTVLPKSLCPRVSFPIFFVSYSEKILSAPFRRAYKQKSRVPSFPHSSASHTSPPSPTSADQARVLTGPLYSAPDHCQSDLSLPVPQCLSQELVASFVLNQLELCHSQESLAHHCSPPCFRHGPAALTLLSVS